MNTLNGKHFELSGIRNLFTRICQHFFNPHKLIVVNKIAINLKDAVSASVTCSLGVDSTGNITVTGQKVLTDTTTNESVNDGEPFPVTLADADQSALQAAIAQLLTPIVQAQLVPPAASASTAVEA